MRVDGYLAEGNELTMTAWDGPREGALGLLRDLHHLHELLAAVHQCEEETAPRTAWLRTRMKQAAPQALVVSQRLICSP